MPRYMLEFKTPLNPSARGQFHLVIVPEDGDTDAADSAIQAEIDRLVTQHGLVGTSDELIPEVIVDVYPLEHATHKFIIPADPLNQPPLLPTQVELEAVLPATHIERKGNGLRYCIKTDRSRAYFLLERRVSPGNAGFTLCETDIFGKPTSIHSAHSDWKVLCVDGIAKVLHTKRVRSEIYAENAAAIEELLAKHAKTHAKASDKEDK